MARFSNLWDESDHPRDRLGRFRSKWKLPPSVKKIVDAILDSFDPRQFRSPQQANVYLRQRGDQKYTPEQRRALREYVRSRQNSDAIDAEMRAGKETDESREILAAMRPLDDDLILTRSLAPEAFGLDAASMAGIEELTGHAIADGAFGNFWLGEPFNNGGISMQILAPRGTRAAFPGGVEVLTDPAHPVRITRVEQNPNGGWRVFGILMPAGTPGEDPEDVIRREVAQTGEELRDEDRRRAAGEEIEGTGTAEDAIQLPERRERVIPERMPRQVDREQAPPAPVRNNGDLPPPVRNEPQPRAGFERNPLWEKNGDQSVEGAPSWERDGEPVTLRFGRSGARQGGLDVYIGDRRVVRDAADLDMLAVEAERANLPEVARWARANRRGFARGQQLIELAEAAAQRARDRREGRLVDAPRVPAKKAAPPAPAPAKRLVKKAARKAPAKAARRNLVQEFIGEDREPGAVPARDAVVRAENELIAGRDRRQIAEDLRDRAEELREGGPLQSTDMVDGRERDADELDDVAQGDADMLDEIADQLDEEEDQAAPRPAKKAATPAGEGAGEGAGSVERLDLFDRLLGGERRPATLGAERAIAVAENDLDNDRDRGEVANDLRERARQIRTDEFRLPADRNIDENERARDADLLDQLADRLAERSRPFTPVRKAPRRPATPPSQRPVNVRRLAEGLNVDEDALSQIQRDIDEGRDAPAAAARAFRRRAVRELGARLDRRERELRILRERLQQAMDERPGADRDRQLAILRQQVRQAENDTGELEGQIVDVERFADRLAEIPRPRKQARKAASPIKRAAPAKKTAPAKKAAAPVKKAVAEKAVKKAAPAKKAVKKAVSAPLDEGSDEESKKLPKFGEPMTPEQARARQALIDRGRRPVQFLGEMDQYLAYDAGARALTHSVNEAERRGDITPEIRDSMLEAVKADDRARLSGLLDELRDGSNLENVGGNTDDIVDFDPALHRSIGGNIANGTSVRVVRPGHRLRLPNGERVLLDRADVQREGDERPAVAQVPRTAARVLVKKATPAKKATPTKVALAEKAADRRAGIRARREQALQNLREQGFENPRPEMVEEQMRALADIEQRDLIRRRGGGGGAPAIKKATPAAPGTPSGAASGKTRVSRLERGHTILVTNRNGEWVPSVRKTGPDVRRMTVDRVAAAEAGRGKGGRRDIFGTDDDGNEIVVRDVPQIQTFWRGDAVRAKKAAPAVKKAAPAVKKATPSALNGPAAHEAALPSRPLGPEALAAIEMYHGGWAAGMNNALRQGRGRIDPARTDETDLARGMDSLMEGQSLPRAVAVDRGVVYAELADMIGSEPKVGSTYVDHGFVSTTTTGRPRLRVGEKNAVLHIRVPQGTRALSTRQTGGLDSLDFGEIVLDRGLTYRITGVETRDGIRHFDVEVVSSPSFSRAKAATAAKKASARKAEPAAKKATKTTPAKKAAPSQGEPEGELTQRQRALLAQVSAQNGGRLGVADPRDPDVQELRRRGLINVFPRRGEIHIRPAGRRLLRGPEAPKKSVPEKAAAPGKAIEVARKAAEARRAAAAEKAGIPPEGRVRVGVGPRTLGGSRDVLARLQEPASYANSENEASLRAFLTDIGMPALRGAARRLGLVGTSRDKKEILIEKLMKEARRRLDIKRASEQPSIPNLDKLRLEDLKTMAREAGLAVPARIRKIDLVEMLKVALPDLKEREGPPRQYHAVESEAVARMREAISEGRKTIKRFGEGAAGITKLIRAGRGEHGPRLVEKKHRHYVVSPERQAAAEVLGSVVAEAVRARAPRAFRSDGKTVYMEFGDGKMAATIPARAAKATQTEGAKRIAILDAIIGNSDRHPWNWLVDEDGEPYAIDHGFTFTNGVRNSKIRRDENGEILPNIPHPDDLFAQLVVDWPGYGDKIKWRDKIDFSRSELEAIRGRLVKQRPEFAVQGRLDWYEQALERLDAIIKRAARP